MLIVSDKIYINIQLLGRHITEFCEKFTYSNPVFFKTKRMGYSTRNISRSISNYTWSSFNGKKYLVIPRGGMHKLKEFMLMKSIPSVRITDNRVSKDLIDFDLKYTDKFISLSPSQNKIVDILVSNEGGLVQMGCGGGKSISMMGLISKIKQPTLIVVHTTALQKQWLEEIGEKTSGSYTLGRLGGNKKAKDGDVVVAIIDSLYSKCYPDGKEPDFSYLANFGMIIFDECHHISAKSFKDVLDNAPCKYKIGVTGTATRKDGLHFLVFDSIGDIILDIPDSELRDRITDFTYKMVNTNVEYVIPNRVTYAGKGQKVSNMDFNKFVDFITKSEARNDLICNNVTKDITDGHKVIILTHRVEHAKYLYERLSKIHNGYLIIGDNSKDVDMNKIKTDPNLNFIVANREIASEGLDIPSLSSLHSVIPSTNYQKLKQQLGRIRRFFEGKLFPTITDYVDNQVYVLSEEDGVITKKAIFEFTAKNRVKFYNKLRKEYHS